MQPDRQRSTGFYALEFDGLRCIAVGLVMVAHFSWTLKNYADWGTPGVRLFFVLSGFLITHILLRARERCDTHAEARTHALGHFFLRRIFRLWPLYFASLAFAYLVHVDGTESSLAWHAFFATNHYIFNHEHWPALLSHYWTLAVEQQFYIVWPFALLFLPRAVLKFALVALLALGPLTRCLPLFGTAKSWDYAGVLLPACVDFFAIGSVVAWAWRTGRFTAVGSRGTLRTGLLALAAWLVIGAVLKTAGIHSTAWLVVDGTIQAAGFGVLLVYLLRFPDSLAARSCRWAPLVFLGQISYGIYIFHNFAHRVGPSLLRRVTGQNYHATEAANILYYVALTIVASVASYYVLENPMRRIGQRLTAGSPGLTPRNGPGPNLALPAAAPAGRDE